MELTAVLRDKFGKAVKTLRRDGFIPAELYGRGAENLHLTVSAKEFNKTLKEAGVSTVVDVVVGDKRYPALVHKVGHDYLTGDVSHVDFYRVRMDEKLRVKVPIEFVGAAPAVHDKGGILNKAMTEVEIETLPANLPHRLAVDLALLDDINKSLYVSDIKAPRGVKVLVDPATVVATVKPPMAEEPKAEPVAEVPDISAVKVETEEKKAERAKGKAEEGKGVETKTTDEKKG